MKLKLTPLNWGKKKTIVTSVFLSAIFLLSILIAVLNITYTTNTSEKDYSLDNIVSHVAAISRKEHSIYQQENLSEVRNYVSSTLYGYGIENETITHRKRYAFNDKIGEPVPFSPKNLYAQIDGTSGTNILLVCHYDACGYKIKYGEASEGSHGAIDDGYGVAVVLELARIYSKESGLKNGIKLAFLDAEEEGCLGSAALVEEYESWLDDVNIVINVEARGETGPVYLFQTSDNNRKVIEFYKNAGFPYTFSMAAEIYDVMPNDTDLSAFLEHGYAGLNVATLDSLKNYHNAGDAFKNIDPDTLAKYCDTLLPLLDEYTENGKYSDMHYFESKDDCLFFTLLPGALVSYSKITGWVFFGIVLALIAALTVVLIKFKKINIIKALISLALDIGLLVILCGIGFIVALISCAICGANYHFMFVIAVSADAGLLITFCIIAIAAAVVLTLIKRKLGISFTEMTVGALVFNAILAIVCAAILFGGSFIFVIPALLMAICAFFTLIKNEKVKSCLTGAVTGVCMLFAFSFYVSLIYSVYVSLTFGALGVLIMCAAIPFLLCTPSALGFYGEKSASVQQVSDESEVAI